MSSCEPVARQLGQVVLAETTLGSVRPAHSCCRPFTRRRSSGGTEPAGGGCDGALGDSCRYAHEAQGGLAFGQEGMRLHEELSRKAGQGRRPRVAVGSRWAHCHRFGCLPDPQLRTRPVQTGQRMAIPAGTRADWSAAEGGSPRRGMHVSHVLDALRGSCERSTLLALQSSACFSTSPPTAGGGVGASAE